jgi:hypothetical protein
LGTSPQRIGSSADSFAVLRDGHKLRQHVPVRVEQGESATVHAEGCGGGQGREVGRFLVHDFLRHAGHQRGHERTEGQFVAALGVLAAEAVARAVAGDLSVRESEAGGGAFDHGLTVEPGQRPRRAVEVGGPVPGPAGAGGKGQNNRRQ